MLQHHVSDLIGGEITLAHTNSNLTQLNNMFDTIDEIPGGLLDNTTRVREMQMAI